MGLDVALKSFLHELDAVKKAGYDTTVMTVITNTTSYANVQRIDGVEKKHGDDLIAVTKR